MPDWAMPVLTLVMGWVGGYLGAARKIELMMIKLDELLKWKRATENTLKLYNEDLLIHDIELQASLKQQGIARARRQMARERGAFSDE